LVKRKLDQKEIQKKTMWKKMSNFFGGGTKTPPPTQKEAKKIVCHSLFCSFASESQEEITRHEKEQHDG